MVPFSIGLGIEDNGAGPRYSFSRTLVYLVTHFVTLVMSPFFHQARREAESQQGYGDNEQRSMVRKGAIISYEMGDEVH